MNALETLQMHPPSPDKEAAETLLRIAQQIQAIYSGTETGQKDQSLDLHLLNLQGLSLLTTAILRNKHLAHEAAIAGLRAEIGPPSEEQDAALNCRPEQRSDSGYRIARFDAAGIAIRIRQWHIHDDWKTEIEIDKSGEALSIDLEEALSLHQQIDIALAVASDADNFFALPVEWKARYQAREEARHRSGLELADHDQILGQILDRHEAYLNLPPRQITDPLSRLQVVLAAYRTQLIKSTLDTWMRSHLPDVRLAPPELPAAIGIAYSIQVDEADNWRAVSVYPYDRENVMEVAFLPFESDRISVNIVQRRDSSTSWYTDKLERKRDSQESRPEDAVALQYCWVLALEIEREADDFFEDPKAWMADRHAISQGPEPSRNLDRTPTLPPESLEAQQ